MTIFRYEKNVYKISNYQCLEYLPEQNPGKGELMVGIDGLFTPAQDEMKEHCDYSYLRTDPTLLHLSFNTHHILHQVQRTRNIGNKI